MAPLFKMLEASFELLVPLVMAAVIDKGIAQKRQPVYYKNVSCFDCIGNRRADMFSYSSIFFGKSGGWVRNRTAACAV